MKRATIARFDYGYWNTLKKDFHKVETDKSVSGDNRQNLGVYIANVIR